MSTTDRGLYGHAYLVWNCVKQAGVIFLHTALVESRLKPFGVIHRLIFLFQTILKDDRFIRRGTFVL